MKKTNVLKVVFVLLCVGGASWLMLRGHVEPIYSENKKMLSIQSVASIEEPSDSRMYEIQNRSLFDSSRRPFISTTPEHVPAIDVQQPASAPLGPIDLVGITIGPNGRVALIKMLGQSEPQSIREQEPLQGWTVSRIKHDRVLLTSGGETKTLQFDKEK